MSDKRDNPGNAGITDFIGNDLTGQKLGCLGTTHWMIPTQPLGRLTLIGLDGQRINIQISG